MLFLLAAFCFVSAVRADLPPLGPIPAEAAGPNIDPAAATRAYLATVPAAAHARSDAYFEGGEWLILWDFLVASAIALLMLNAGWSAAWRDRAANFSSHPNVRVAVYAIFYNLVAFLLGFPMLVYESFYREHQYGMANQTFGPWFGEQMKGLAVNLVIFTLLAHHALRRFPPRPAHLVAVGQRGRDLFPRPRDRTLADGDRAALQQVHAPN